MSLSGKLQKWVDASLITSDQKSKIIAHEKEFSEQRWKYGVIYIGLCSILLGVALIIASNWQVIPWQMKLSVHFAVNTILASFIWIWRHNPARDHLREGAIFILWGLTLTLIALIGQVFQLGGETYIAMRIWFWLTTPMILLFAQNRFTMRLWALAFIIYIPYDMVASIIDITSNITIQQTVFLAAGIVVPLLAWNIGAHPRFAVNRPTIATTLRETSVALALFGASFASTAFYHQTLYNNAYVPVVYALGVIAARFVLHTKNWSAQERANIDLICICGLFICVPFFAVTHGSVIALLHFLTLWLLAGWLWQETGHSHLVTFSIIVITLRIFIGFLEIFGTMLMSGLGFILIGALLLTLVEIARRVGRRLQRMVP
jgi:uncharacterized membrane protein